MQEGPRDAGPFFCAVGCSRNSSRPGIPPAISGRLSGVPPRLAAFSSGCRLSRVITRLDGLRRVDTNMLASQRSTLRFPSLRRTRLHSPVASRFTRACGIEHAQRSSSVPSTSVYPLRQPGGEVPLLHSLQSKAEGVFQMICCGVHVAVERCVADTTIPDAYVKFLLSTVLTAHAACPRARKVRRQHDEVPTMANGPQWSPVAWCSRSVAGSSRT